MIHIYIYIYTYIYRIGEVALSLGPGHLPPCFLSPFPNHIEKSKVQYIYIILDGPSRYTTLFAIGNISMVWKLRKNGSFLSRIKTISMVWKLRKKLIFSLKNQDRFLRSGKTYLASQIPPKRIFIKSFTIRPIILNERERERVSQKQFLIL